MAYFKILSLILGALMILSCLWAFFFPKSYESIAMKLLPENCPAWIPVMSLGILTWIGWTWYQWIQVRSGLALIVTLFLSLAIFKAFLLLFQYTQFRKLAMALLTTDRPAMKVILVSYLVLGAGLIAIGLLI